MKMQLRNYEKAPCTNDLRQTCCLAYTRAPLGDSSNMEIWEGSTVERMQDSLTLSTEDLPSHSTTFHNISHYATLYNLPPSKRPSVSPSALNPASFRTRTALPSRPARREQVSAACTMPMLTWQNVAKCGVNLVCAKFLTSFLMLLCYSMHCNRLWFAFL
jgi:hypothetical protein